MDICEKVAYIKGLAEGLSLDESTKEGKILAAVIDVLSDITDEICEIEDGCDELMEQLDAVDEDLSNVEDIIYGDDDCDCCDDDCDCCTAENSHLRADRKLETDHNDCNNGKQAKNRNCERWLSGFF